MLGISRVCQRVFRAHEKCSLDSQLLEIVIGRSWSQVVLHVSTEAIIVAAKTVFQHELLIMIEILYACSCWEMSNKILYGMDRIELRCSTEGVHRNTAQRSIGDIAKPACNGWHLRQ